MELKKALDAALESGRYLISISYKDGEVLNHFWKTKNFPKEELIPTVRHIKDDIYNKELDTPDAQWT
jgi:hypothetical protein